MPVLLAGVAVVAAVAAMVATSSIRDGSSTVHPARSRSNRLSYPRDEVRVVQEAHVDTHRWFRCIRTPGNAAPAI
uniref:Putative secreted protein n=1 Tax=Anopheles darlingi TaxID=43151 RepID=A0A2M4D7P5_ANODA